MKFEGGALTKKRAFLLDALERSVARAAGFQSMQGPAWDLRFKRALALKGRYAAYLFSRYVNPASAKAGAFWGKKYRWGRPEHSSSMFFFGVLEHESEVRLTRYLIRTLADADVFYDIGANFGFYSLLAAEIVESGKIFAFEPVPYVFEDLRKNAVSSYNIQAFDRAVSDRAGKVDFDEPPTSRHTGGSLEEKEAGAPGQETFVFRRIQVTATTVDEFREQSGAVPTVIKIDVEGSEHRVIGGARRTLAAASPVVIMEVWKPPLDNRNHRAAIRILGELGYRPYSLTREGSLLSLDSAALEAELSAFGESVNLVFRKG